MHRAASSPPWSSPRRDSTETRLPSRPAPATVLLLPLGTVLVPGASLRLRMVEPRALDLVAACGRTGAGFGACLAADGVVHGTGARVADFGTGDDGVLVLRVRGGRRFRVRGTRVRDDGLLVGEVEWMAPDPDDALRPEHALLGTLLQRILERAGGEHARAPAARPDEAAWVGWRLAELLPITEAERQRLLGLPDPHARLDRLLVLVSAEPPA